VRILRCLILLLAAVQTACSDPFGPRFWLDVPDTVQLHSLSRPEFVGRPSAIDLVSLGVLPVELPGATGGWDIALVDDGDGLAFVPAGAFDGFTSRAAIAVMPAQRLEDVTEAPRDTAAYRQTAVRVQPNTVYVMRSRRAECGFGSSGFRYAKVRAVDIQPELGRLLFEIVRNPYCNDRALVPPES
jgi:hypothetical protein